MSAVLEPDMYQAAAELNLQRLRELEAAWFRIAHTIDRYHATLARYGLPLPPEMASEEDIQTVRCELALDAPKRNRYTD